VLGKGEYPVMAAVLRGSFDTKFTQVDTANSYISYSAFGLSVKTTHFPDISVAVTRQDQASSDAHCPVSGGVTTLQWGVTNTNCLIVTNPFAKNPTNMVWQNNDSYSHGTAAVNGIKDATSTFDDFDKYVKDSGDLLTSISSEQSVVPEPSCNQDGATGGASAPNTNYTMCWVFKDGRP
jgi:hypothetical protein